MPGIGYVILLWHSLDVPYNYFDKIYINLLNHIQFFLLVIYCLMRTKIYFDLISLFRRLSCCCFFICFQPSTDQALNSETTV